MDAGKLLAQTQKFLAIETNNLAWDLIDKSGADSEKMIAAAHTSFFFWSAVGTPANIARAHGTVSRALVVRGAAAATLALEHAQKYLAWATDGAEAGAWDRVFAHSMMARAQAALGEMGPARDARRWADEALASVTDPEDRKICDRELSHGPWFGLDSL